MSLPSVPAPHYANSGRAHIPPAEEILVFPRLPAWNVKTGSKSFTRTRQHGRFPGMLELVRFPLGTAHRQAVLSSARISHPPNHDTAPATKTGALGSLSDSKGQCLTNTSGKRRARSFQPVSQIVDSQSCAFTTRRAPPSFCGTSSGQTCASRVARSGDDGYIGNPGHDTPRRLPTSRNGGRWMNAWPNSCRDIRNPFWQHDGALVRDVDHAEGRHAKRAPSHKTFGSPRPIRGACIHSNATKPGTNSDFAATRVRSRGGFDA